jgi:hypothetical protein
MKKIALTVVLCLVLAACSGTQKNADDTKVKDAKPVESLLTTKDMTDCEQHLGVKTPKTAADVYALPADSPGRVKDCAYDMEKQRMPLLSDLIDKYKLMLQQGNKECDKDIGTHYGDVCMKNSKGDADTWYNLAVDQRTHDALPNPPESSKSAKP